MVTDATGRIAVQAPEGTSCLFTETQAPPGYDLASPDHKTLVATADGVEYTFVDPPEFVPAPALTITKDATEASYNAVGQTIHYSITATNSGNTTLAAVTITDPNAVLGTCTPANGSSRAPGQSITCVATHVVTQADIDAGHYLNQACVDDGAGGAASICATKDVPSVPAPALTITKDATEASYNAVGQTIHYSITATNSGNTTLAAVTITDPNAVLGTCTPANGSSRAPGQSITCVATHVVTQADIDAGHYLNQACVDDGAGGAASICATKDVPSVPAPALTITKDATEASYNAVGQTIHYSITATNSGNTTLAAVTITDPNAVLGTCTPANGSSRAPGQRSPAWRPTSSPRPTSMPATTSTRPASMTAPVERQRSAPPSRRAERPGPGPDHHQGRHRGELQRGRSDHPLLDHCHQRRQHDARRGDHHRSERRPRDVHAGQRLVAGPRRHDHLRGDPRRHPGRHRCRPLPQHRLRR